MAATSRRIIAVSETSGKPETVDFDANIMGTGNTAARPASGVGTNVDLYLLVDGSTRQFQVWDGSTWQNIGGNVTGPGSSTDNALPRWDGASGTLIQNSGVIVDDSDNMTLPGTLDMQSNPIVGRALTEVAPTAIAAQANDYDPTSFGTADILRITLTGDQTITGFAQPGAGDNETFVLYNTDGVDTVTLAHENVASSANNRISTHTGANVTVGPGERATLIYDSTANRWLVLGVAGAAGAGDVTAAASIADNAVVRGDGGSKGVQGSALEITDAGDLDMNDGAIVARGLTSITDTLAAQQDNYNPTGFHTADILVITTTGGDQNISGFDAPGAGENQMIWISVDALSSGAAVILDSSSSSLEANRVLTTAQKNFYVRPNTAVRLFYDTTQSRWIPLANTTLTAPAGDGGGGDRIIYSNGSATNRLETSGAVINGVSLAQISRVVSLALDNPSATGAITGHQPVVNTQNLSATTNNLDPGGAFDLLRITLTGDQTLTGIVAPALGENGFITITNADTLDALTITSEDAGSTAANRFSLPSGYIVLEPDEGIDVIYDATSSRWKIAGHVRDFRTYRTGLAAFSTDQNDFEPTDWDQIESWVITPGSGDRTITGFAAPQSGDLRNHWIRNESATNRLILAHQNGGSAAANQIETPNGIDLVLHEGEWAHIRYQGSGSDWQVVGVSRDPTTRDRREVSPAAIAAQANDYNPTDFQTSDFVRITLTGNQTITGFVAPTMGSSDVHVIINADSADTLTLANESASSTAANRIATHTGSDFALGPGESATIVYDDTTARWRVTGPATAAGSGDVTAAATLTDNAVIRGDGGAKGVQDSGVLIDDADNVSGVVGLTMTGDLTMGGAGSAIIAQDYTEVSPTALAAQANNYDPASFGTADVLRQDLTGSQTITGFAAPGAGDNERFVIVNIDGASDQLTLANENASSTAANRIAGPNGGNIVLDPGECAMLTYDATSSRWRAVALSRDFGVYVVGPASSTDNAVARFDSTTGKLIQNSGVTVDDNNDVAGVRRLQHNETINQDAETDFGNSGTADTLDWNTGNHAKSTLTGNVTYTFTAPAGGGTVLSLRIIQDATGGRTITWPATVKWPGGTAPNFGTMTANQETLVTLRYDGTNYFANATLDGSGAVQAYS